MKILYDPTPDGEDNHKIYYVVWDKDWFAFTHTTNIALSEKDVDEIAPENKDLCLDLINTQRITDASGDNKYAIDADGDVVEKEGWVRDDGME